MDTFKELFYEKSLPIKEVAKAMQVSVSSIGAFRHRHALPGRGWSNGKHPMLGVKATPCQIEQMRLRMKGRFVKEKNWNWKGGRYKTFGGYIRLHMPGWHDAYKGYVLEHRYIMEKHLNRELTSDEIVHHKNGNKTDNRIDNLCLHTRAEHARHHNPVGSHFGIHAKLAVRK